MSDPSKIERVLLNLVENAAKYAPGQPIELQATRAAGEVRLSVVDHGPGIPARDRERVFERFVQLDQSSTRRQGGTGLGLHLCRQLAALVDGRMTLDETPGGGCTFSLTIPAERALDGDTDGHAHATTADDDISGAHHSPFGNLRARPVETGDHRRAEPVR